MKRTAGFSVLVFTLSLTAVAVAQSRDTPSRTQVAVAMGAVSDRVRACGDGWHGSVQVRTTFESSGRATSAQVTSDSPRQVAACVESAAMTAQVPAFREPSFSVSFPFRL